MNVGTINFIGTPTRLEVDSVVGHHAPPNTSHSSGMLKLCLLRRLTRKRPSKRHTFRMRDLDVRLCLLHMGTCGGTPQNVSRMWSSLTSSNCEQVLAGRICRASLVAVQVVIYAYLQGRCKPSPLIGHYFERESPHSTWDLRPTDRPCPADAELGDPSIA